MVALGLGLLVVITIALVQGHLEDQLEADLPTEAPTAFLIDIRPDQWAGVEALLRQGQASRIDSAPIVLARLTDIDGKPAAQVAEESGQGWLFGRDIRMTYLDELPSDNRIVDGELWHLDGVGEASLEIEFARSLGLDLGADIGIEVRGQPYQLRVTSLRQVDWEGFGINFFLVAEPGALARAPQTRLAAVRLPSDTEQTTQDSIATEFPNVTMFQIRQLLDKVVGLLTRLNLGVRVLGAFTVVAGLLILAGAAATGAAERGRQVALLKTIGMTRIEIVRTFATEYVLIGLIAGVIAAIFGTGITWYVVTQEMEIDWHLRPWTIVLTLAISVFTVHGGRSARQRRCTGAAADRHPARRLRHRKSIGTEPMVSDG